MAAAYVQSKLAAYSTVSNGVTMVFDSNVTAGNTIIVIGWHSYLGCPPSVTDNLGNTYTAKGTRPTIGGTNVFEIFTAPVTTGGACTVTFSMSCGLFRQLAIVEASGLISNPFDQQGSGYAVGTSSPFSGGAVTPSEVDEYIVALFGNINGTAGDLTDGGAASMTERGNNANNDSTLFDKVYGSMATLTPDVTFTGTKDLAGLTATFKATAGAAGTPVIQINKGHRPRPFAPGLAR